MVSRWSDRLTFISLCLLVFVLPATIAGVAVFASLAIFFFLLKKSIAVFGVWKKPGVPFCWKGLFSALALPQPVGIVSIPAGVFVLVCFLSIFTSAYPSLSLEAFVGKTLKTALLFFAVQECLTTPSRVRWFLRACVASAFIVCLDALWQQYTGFDIFKQHTVVDGRLNASFNHPNGLGAYLIVMIPLFVAVAFCWVVRGEKHIARIAGKLFLVTAMAALLLFVMGFTFSRGAWAGLACAGVVFLLFDKRTWLPCILIAGIFFYIFQPLLIEGRHVTLIKDNVHAVGMGSVGGSGRITYWHDAWRIIGDNPVLGTGLNTYTKVIKQYVEVNQNYAHNCYLQVAAELGVVGLAVILWFFAAVFMFVRRKILAENIWEDRLVLIALMAGWVGLLVESSVDNTFYSVQLSVLLWVMMGLIVVFSYKGKEAASCIRK
jgi:putative inorganic carbon (HCO3(-)) transporter